MLLPVWVCCRVFLFSEYQYLTVCFLQGPQAVAYLRGTKAWSDTILSLNRVPLWQKWFCCWFGTQRHLQNGVCPAACRTPRTGVAGDVTPRRAQCFNATQHNKMYHVWEVCLYSNRCRYAYCTHSTSRLLGVFSATHTALSLNRRCANRSKNAVSAHKA